MFVAPSTHDIHEVALIQSEIVHLTEDERGKCLYFSYFMHGSRVGELKVSVKVNADVVVWSVKPSDVAEKDKWLYARVPLWSYGKPLQVQLLI